MVTEIAEHLSPAFGDNDIDLSGRLLMSAPTEAHAHLDKALTADDVANPEGDLAGAIAHWQAYRPTLSVESIALRAERAARMMLANGTTSIRTHVDVADDIGVRGVEAIDRVRRVLAGLIDIQIVALVGRPTTGMAGAGNRAALRDAIQAGADVVGGCPHLDAEPERCARYLLELAAELDRSIDLHADETLDIGSTDVATMARWVRRNGFNRTVAASHSVSMVMTDESAQRALADELAEAKVGIITLPQTNLYLLGRDRQVATPRSLAPVRALLRANVVVAAGADNLQDPFNPVGRADAFETASLLISAGHVSPAQAWDAVTSAPRRLMGLPAAGPVVGQVADLVALPAASLREAIAMAPSPRLVLRRGVVVSDRS